ncbi:TRAP transporter small permease [Pseudomonadota bacterium]
MQFLDNLMTALSIALNKFGGLVVLPLMTVMMTVDVILRYVFNSPLSWGLEASQHMLLLVFVFGMLEAFRTGAHIRMDLCYRLFTPAVRRVVNVLYSLLVVGVFILLASKGWEEAMFLKEINEVTQYIHMPIWMFYVVIVLVAALIVLFFMLRALAVMRGQRQEVEDEHVQIGDMN